ncbi:hypothetical protein GCM10011391_30780 [Pullulanibacillus camelliae]|uniref:Uncharacterized protein n=2 Tax=Pullulanibacillus camelliae TaxID=1707096 RepID=A0A8J2YK18_9BACL|nr:hypothetical protein GCM10011391_30780 [Pullulanibacillus camelliae]
MVSMLAGVGVGAAAVTMMRQRNKSQVQKMASEYLKDEMKDEPYR